MPAVTASGAAIYPSFAPVNQIIALHEVSPSARPKVDAFLAARPEIAKLVAPLAMALREVFGPDTNLTLKVRIDPEIPGEQWLVTTVYTSDDDDIAYEKLCRFHDHWWNDKPLDDHFPLVVEFTSK